jgi:transcriptional antiterminator NusG
MNWYVLYTLSQKSNKIITNLNRKKELIAFIPEYEICHRKTKEITIKPMFSNYIFVKTDLNQSEFNDLLLKMKDENDGLIKQLKNCETSALRESEIEFFEMILDEQYVVRLSYGYQENGITHVTKGPLKPFEKHIVKVDKHNQCAYLDLLFFDRRIMLGIDIKCKN